MITQGDISNPSVEKVEWLEQDGQKLEVLSRPGWQLVLDGPATRAREAARKANHWKGGIYKWSHGYIGIFVGKGHREDQGSGYALEHRLVMENKIGRELNAGEIVHHLDEDRSNNHPDNLALKVDQAWHMIEHRVGNKRNLRLRHPSENRNEIINCDCGCGMTRNRFDRSNAERRYIHGHNRAIR